MMFNNRFSKFILSGLLIFTTILSMGTWFWRSYPLELLSNFRVYYLVLSIAIAIIYLILQAQGLRIKILIYLSCGLIAFNAVSIIPWYLPHSQLTDSGNQIRVLSFNINTENDRWDMIADAIQKQNPDLATIIEGNIKSTRELTKRLKKSLPFTYQTVTPNGMLLMFSKIPLISPQTQVFDHGKILTTSLQINHKNITLITAHPVAPINPDLFQLRHKFWQEIKKYLEKQSTSLIFMGDFNLTFWSSDYLQLIHDTNLHNTRLGFGIEPSWVELTSYFDKPKWLTHILKIPIDHILVSQDIKVVNCRTIKAGNSDHRILWSDLII